jgi:hypothetical protein
MGTRSQGNSDYTRTWSVREIAFATLADGPAFAVPDGRFRPALMLLHTVRTQLDHFSA